MNNPTFVPVWTVLLIGEPPCRIPLNLRTRTTAPLPGRCQGVLNSVDFVSNWYYNPLHVLV
jgi:hypothetical protein